MVCFDEMDPDKAVVLVTFEGGGSAYSDDLNNVALSQANGLVATSRRVCQSPAIVAAIRYILYVDSWLSKAMNNHDKVQFTSLPHYYQYSKGGQLSLFFSCEERMVEASRVRHRWAELHTQLFHPFQCFRVEFSITLDRHGTVVSTPKLGVETTTSCPPHSAPPLYPPTSASVRRPWHNDTARNTTAAVDSMVRGRRANKHGTVSCNPGDGILIWGFGTGRQEHVLPHGKAEGGSSVVRPFAWLTDVAHYFCCCCYTHRDDPPLLHKPRLPIQYHVPAGKSAGTEHLGANESWFSLVNFSSRVRRTHSLRALSEQFQGQTSADTSTNAGAADTHTHILNTSK